MTVDCVHEQDVLDAIASNGWPDRCDVDLGDHVRECAVCADVAAIAGPLAEERERCWNDADLPPACLVWWRAQMRARAEAARLARRPIAMAQAVAFVSLGLAGLVVVPMVWPWIAAAGDTIRGAFAWVVPRALDISNAFTLATGGSVPLIAVTVSAVLAPVLLLYFALVDS
jgi:hypothetical protein